MNREEVDARVEELEEAVPASVQAAVKLLTEKYIETLRALAKT